MEGAALAKWQNRARCLSKLNAYPAAVRDRIRPALAQGADQIVAMQKNLVPTLASANRDRTAGALKASIRWVWGSAKGVMGATANAGDFAISIIAGNPAAFYARFVEFGRRAYAAGEFRVSLRGSRGGKVYRQRVKKQTSASAPHPYFYPAVRAFLPSIKKNVQAAVRAATRSIASK